MDAEGDWDWAAADADAEAIVVRGVDVVMPADESDESGASDADADPPPLGRMAIIYSLIICRRAGAQERRSLGTSIGQLVRSLRLDAFKARR